MSSRTCSLRVCVAIGVWLLMVGCASLYQPLPRRIDATHLSCEAHPSLVDGDLATTSFLKVKGFLLKRMTLIMGTVSDMAILKNTGLIFIANITKRQRSTEIKSR